MIKVIYFLGCLLCFFQSYATCQAQDMQQEISLLYGAIEQNNILLMERLLCAGIPANIRRPSDTRTPLQWAVYKGNLEAVKLLLSHCADRTVRDRAHNSLLHLVIIAPLSSERKKALAQLLLENRVLIDEYNTQLATPLTLAASRGEDELVKLFSAHKACINSKTKNGDTSLILATQEQKFSTVKLLLELGAEVNARNFLGETALHKAADLPESKYAELLIQYGATIDVVNEYGNTPLHRAFAHDRRQTAELLLNAGARTDRENNRGFTPLRYFRRYS